MATKPVQPCALDNPRDTFEHALALVCPGNSFRKAIAPRHTPIVTRLDAQATEKRALTDAAKALAQLWKVSPHLVR